MKRKTKEITTNLSREDVSALLCALPLISLANSSTNGQKLLNQSVMNTIFSKLQANIFSFTANEYRILYCAVGFAIEYLSGVDHGFIPFSAIDPEWRNDLRKHFFSYNRLNSLLAPIVDSMDIS